MDKVKSVVFPESRKIELTEFDKPEISEDSLLLDVEICGMCGTDIDIYEGSFEGISFPLIPGHEFVGIVEKIGERAGKSMITFGGALEEGDRVAVKPRIPCGRCYYCRMYPHREELCGDAFVYGGTTCRDFPHLFGAWSQYIYLLPRTRLFKLPQDIDPKVVVLTEPLASGLRAVERAKGPSDATKGDGLGIGDSIVIQGAGSMGHMVLIAAKLSGVGKIIVIDREDHRLSMARQFGADYVINMQEVDDSEKRIEEVSELTGGVGADVVLECAGAPSAIPEGIRMVRRGGKYIELGVVIENARVEVAPYDICRKEIQLIGQYSYSSSAFVKSIEVLKMHRLPYERLVTGFSIEEWKEAFDAFRTKKNVKTAIIP